MNDIITKFCSMCEVEKESKDFTIDRHLKSGLSSKCRQCDIKTKKLWRKKNPNRYLKQKLTSCLRVYGITLEQYNQMFEKQNHRCAICGGVETGNPRYENFAVDHNHKTGKIRGLLCHSCNITIGNAKDNISILQSAIKYLKRNL